MSVTFLTNEDKTELQNTITNSATLEDGQLKFYKDAVELYSVDVSTLNNGTSGGTDNGSNGGDTTSGLPITNLIVNGNFANTDNWVSYGTTNTLTANDNVATVAHTGTSKSVYFRQIEMSTFQAGKNYFLMWTHKQDNTTYTTSGFRAYRSTAISSPMFEISNTSVVADEWQTDYGIVTMPTDFDATTETVNVDLRMYSGVALTNCSMSVKNVMAICVEDFEALGITTADAMADFIINNANGYIDGTQYIGEGNADNSSGGNSGITVGALYALNKFNGKTCVVFGDSIMDSYGVPEKIAELSGMTVHNIAVGGTRASQHIYENYNAFSFCNLVNAIANNDFTTQETQAESIGHNAPTRIATLKSIDFSKVDYVVVAYGTNDFTGNATINTGEDFTDFGNAYAYGLLTLMTAYPHLQFLLVTPMFRADCGTVDEGFSNSYLNTNTNLTLIDFVEAIKNIGNEAHIPVCDNYFGLQINQFNYAYYLASADLVHPNAETCTPMIASRIYGQMSANL